MVHTLLISALLINPTVDEVICPAWATAYETQVMGTATEYGDQLSPAAVDQSLGALLDRFEGGRARFCLGSESARIDGPFQLRYANGRVGLTGQIADGKVSGMLERFRQDGGHDRTWFFRGNGTLYKVEDWHANKELKSTCTFNAKGPDGYCTQFFDTGKVAIAQVFKDGLRDGPYSLWNRRGKIVLRGDFCGGKRCGRWTNTSDAAGAGQGARLSYVEANFKDDLLHGRAEILYEGQVHNRFLAHFRDGIPISMHSEASDITWRAGMGPSRIEYFEFHQVGQHVTVSYSPFAVDLQTVVKGPRAGVIYASCMKDTSTDRKVLADRPQVIAETEKDLLATGQADGQLGQVVRDAYSFGLGECHDKTGQPVPSDLMKDLLQEVTAVEVGMLIESHDYLEAIEGLVQPIFVAPRH